MQPVRPRTDLIGTVLVHPTELVLHHAVEREGVVAGSVHDVVKRLLDGALVVQEGFWKLHGAPWLAVEKL